MQCFPPVNAELISRIHQRETQRLLTLDCRPLIGEFGVPRALAYLAQTPFQIEENNLRVSAQRYQDRARDALLMDTPCGSDPATLASTARK